MTVRVEPSSAPRLPGVRRAGSAKAVSSTRPQQHSGVRKVIALTFGALAVVAFVLGFMHSGALAFLGLVLAFVAIRTAWPALARQPETAWNKVLRDPSNLRYPFRKGIE